jgi:hypothetical protein
MGGVVTAKRGTQVRGRSIAMTPEEIDAFLGDARTCRVATISSAGPHVAPMWFYWDGQAIWLNSVVRSKRWADLQLDSRIAVVIDAGGEYSELRGVEITGHAEPVGEVPRVGLPLPELDEPERGFHVKYRDPATSVSHDGRHGVLRVTPETVVSWDFRKLKTS